MDNTTKIQVQKLNFWYGATQTLHQISIDFPEKKITTIIGASGSGKSTLLRTFNRIFELHQHQHAQGDILLDGKNILDKGCDVAWLRSKVGMVFQKPTPFPMSIFNNVAFGVRLYETSSRAVLAERVEWALRQAALWEEVKDKLSRHAETLSGGQQQRLCIARAIAIHPEVLLLDEPCSALDPNASHRIEELLLTLQNDYTIIMVTHNMQQAMRISHYTGYLYQGSLIEFNDTQTLFNHPEHPETKRYVSGSVVS